MRLETESTGLENDVAVLSYSDPIICERAVVIVEVTAPDAEAQGLGMEEDVFDFEADVPDTKDEGLDVEAEVVIRVVVSVI